MPRRKPSKGKCAYCGAEIAKNGVSKHRLACSERQAIIQQAERRKVASETLYHLRVQDATAGADFWLDLEMRGSKSLKELDSYLRGIWLECCGHLSQFSVGGWQGEEISMSRKAGEVWGTLCDEHARNHPHDNYGEPTPLVNSPRVGLCGYDGPAEPPY
jgi:hypothetical protein